MWPPDRTVASAGSARAALVVLGLVVVPFVLLSGCASEPPERAASASSVTRTPEFSVSSTFSLPSLPGASPSVPSATPNPSAVPSDRPLVGRVIALDPGHNGGNAAAPDVVGRLVDGGGGGKTVCDTAGTVSAAGYPEHAFTWDVAQRAAVVLRARGAQVVLTRAEADGVGPCLDERARIANRPGTDVAVSLHADGGVARGRGFTVVRPGLLPGRTDDIVGPSRSLATAVHDALLATGTPTSTYTGNGGYDERTDRGGLNLSTVPKVEVEFGNLRNEADAARLADPAYRQRLAVAVADGLADYLFGR